MKYINLVGRKFDCSNFNYFVINWRSTERIGTGRGQVSNNPFIVAEHKICNVKGPLFGLECVYENLFIYSIEELEKTGQLTEKDLESNPEIY